MDCLYCNDPQPCPHYIDGKHWRAPKDAWKSVGKRGPAVVLPFK